MPLDGERVELLYAVTRSLATIDEVDELVRFATRRLREVFSADGCAILLLDEKRREFSFPVASQRAGALTSASALSEVRFPADRGIAGAVLAGGEAILVNDVQNDPRFYSGVDYEKARLYARLGDEIATLRGLARLVGAGVVAVGALLAGGTVFATLARGLPLSAALSRPSLFGGLVVAGLGAVLLRAARGRTTPGQPATS